MLEKCPGHFIYFFIGLKMASWGNIVCFLLDKLCVHTVCYFKLCKLYIVLYCTVYITVKLKLSKIKLISFKCTNNV